MSAVTVTRCAEGYRVERTFRNLPAASRGLDALLGIHESAFEPVAPLTTLVADPATVRLEVAIEAAESDDPAPHDGRALFDNTKDED